MNFLKYPGSYWKTHFTPARWCAPWTYAFSYSQYSAEVFARNSLVNWFLSLASPVKQAVGVVFQKCVSCPALETDKGKEEAREWAAKGASISPNYRRDPLAPTMCWEIQNSHKPILEKPEQVHRDQNSCWIYGTLGTSICQVPWRQPWHWHRWRWIFTQSSEPSDSINPQGFDDEFLSFLFYLFSL